MSTCTIPDFDGVECKTSVNGKFTTNLRNHLKKHHPSQLKEVEEKDKKKKATNASQHRKPPSGQQLTLYQSLESKKKYDSSSERQKQISKKLVVFLACTGVPYSLIERDEFKALIAELDCRYSVPSRSMVNTTLNDMMSRLVSTIKSHLSKARKVNICCDIWTKKGMSASFMGVTAHFLSSNKRHFATLAVRRMPSPHTGENIFMIIQSVISDFEISDIQLNKVLTDNGSNMVKAFKNISMKKYTIDDDASEPDPEDDDTSSPEKEDELDLIMSEDEAADDNLLDNDSAHNARKDIRDFRMKESEHEQAFLGFRRLSCFAHTLQLVVVKFDEVTSFKQLLKKTHKLVSKVNRSCKATERLISVAGKKLVADCPTRWSSTFLMISRLLLVQTEVGKVLEELGWDNLHNSEWRQLKRVQELLEPFAQYTSLIGGNEYTTISAVCPIVVELQMHLVEMKKRTGIVGIVDVLQKEMKRRFEYLIDPQHASFDPLYLTATALDPLCSVTNKLK